MSCELSWQPSQFAKQGIKITGCRRKRATTGCSLATAIGGREHLLSPRRVRSQHGTLWSQASPLSDALNWSSSEVTLCDHDTINRITPGRYPVKRLLRRRSCPGSLVFTYQQWLQARIRRGEATTSSNLRKASGAFEVNLEREGRL
jgi:hypothetical protein